MPIIPGTLGATVPVGRFNYRTIWQTPITVSTSSQASDAFAAATNFIRVHNSGICNFKIGPPGTTASVGGAGRLPADHTEYFGVCPGDVITVITDT